MKKDFLIILIDWIIFIRGTRFIVKSTSTGFIRSTFDSTLGKRAIQIFIIDYIADASANGPFFPIRIADSIAESVEFGSAGESSSAIGHTLA